MAIVSDIENKLEQSWISALRASADLVALLDRKDDSNIKAFFDVSQSEAFPVVTVAASGAMEEPGLGISGLEIVWVELTAWTYIADDEDGQIAGQMLGALRDVQNDAAIATTLSASQNLTVYAVLQEGAANRNDDGILRQRSLTAKCHAVAQDIAP